MHGATVAVLPIDKVLARRLRAERSGAGLSQADLGIRLGWSRQTVGVIESGEKRPLTLGEIVAICRVLNVHLEDLVRGATRDDLDALGLP